MRVLLITLFLAIPGCLLDTEECGQNFIQLDGQCIPRETPEPFRGVPENEGSEIRDVSQPADLGIDSLIEDAAPTQDANLLSPFSDYNQILLVDRTKSQIAEQPPLFQAVILMRSSSSMNRRTSPVREPASSMNRSMTPSARISKAIRAVLGRPDGRAVSLGPQGFVRVQLSLDGPLRVTDRVRIVELEERPDDLDRYEAFICARDSEGLDGCRSLGEGVAGRTSFTLDAQ